MDLKNQQMKPGRKRQNGYFLLQNTVICKWGRFCSLNLLENLLELILEMRNTSRCKARA